MYLPSIYPVLARLSRSLDKYFLHHKKYYRGDSRNYMPPILVPSCLKCIATQIVVIAKLNEIKDFISRGFVCDIIPPRNILPVQS